MMCYVGYVKFVFGEMDVVYFFCVFYFNYFYDYLKVEGEWIDDLYYRVIVFVDMVLIYLFICVMQWDIDNMLDWF